MRARRGAMAVVLTSAVVAAQSPAPRIDAIGQDDLRADLTFPASDAMKDRLTNTNENLVASDLKSSVKLRRRR